MIKKAISKYLSEKGITQSYLSKKTGMSPQAICLALKDERNLDIDEYVKICDALELPYSFFFEKAKEVA